jgi:hypothetical protein
MSGINGDKARFHRERKQKIARRMRNESLKGPQTKSTPAAPTASKSAKVSA